MRREKLTSPGNDKVSIAKAKEWLSTQGYTNIRKAPFGGGRDIDAEKDGKDYFFEVKYTSKPEGWGSTVMASELIFAMGHRENSFFILCRGKESDLIEKWIFRLFTSDQFLQLCRLDSVLFRYDYKKPTSYRKRSVRRATWAMIEEVSEFMSDYDPWLNHLLDE